MVRRTRNQSGFVLISTMLLLALLLALAGAYYVLTSLETGTVRYQRQATTGFYSAEGALNVRAEDVRQVFVGFNVPSGSGPAMPNPCQGSNRGTGQMACRDYQLNNRKVQTYVAQDASNPYNITIPQGERYQFLNAQEFRYTVRSNALNSEGHTEAQLDLRFKVRLVPLFQFAAFYNKDLEILPGPAMTLSGPVHTNGDLYLYSNSATLSISGQVTTAGELWRGRKDGSVHPSCNNQQVRIMDPVAFRALIPVCPSRYNVRSTDVLPWNNMIQMKVQEVTVPGPDIFDAGTGHIYWDHADLRLVLAMDASNNPIGVQVRNANDSVNTAQTTAINNCGGTLSGKAVGSAYIRNQREGDWVRLLDVDMRNLLSCLETTNWLGAGKRLDDTTDGGLVFHLTVKGPRAGLAQSLYGVRVRNAARLQSNAMVRLVRGMTIVSDQPAYVMGDFNAVNKIPAAVMADAINELSGNWDDANSHLGLGTRVAASMTINAAFLAGTDTTGGVEGHGGHNGSYNGGLENYPRFHENWNGKLNTYRGSFVSLGKPLHSIGGWAGQSYNPPDRDWNYDTSFNNTANLPPITPRFVYLRQELFVRDFEQ